MAIVTLTNTEQSRAGASACVEALRVIEMISERSMHRSQNDQPMPMEKWWQIQEEAVAAMFQSQIADKPRDFIAGFVAAFAEYAFCIHSSGVPNLNRWRPEAAMTNEEKLAERAILEFECTGLKHAAQVS